MLPLVALALAFLLLLVAVVAAVGARVVDRAQAQHAADAAALAGVVDGRAGAEHLAQVNGAELISFSPGGAEVWVLVNRDGVRAEATAERRVEPSISGCPASGCSDP